MKNRIDLTQFEGHTKGADGEIAWRIVGDNFVMNDETPQPDDRFIAYVQPQNGGTHKVIRFSDADARLIAAGPNFLAELKRCYEELDEFDKLVGLLIENHFVETSPYETVKHLIETHQDYRASE